MIRNILKFFLGFAILLQVACNKEEGTGGEASIKGVVYIKQFDRVNKKLLGQVPASGEDIFISYGNNNTVDDRLRIGPDGSFEFNYLRKGEYKIFVYSDDSINYTNNSTTILRIINVSGTEKKHVNDTIFIYKGFDFNDGLGVIYGKVMVQDVDRFYGNILSTYPASNADVFLSLSNNLSVLERARTGIDGSFEFNRLIDGSYKIFALSETPTGADIPVEKEFNISSGNKANADTIYIKNVLDLDDGTATIKGRIYVYNFDKDNGVDITGEYWGQDVEVYLIYGDKTTYDMRVRTSYDGSFEFPRLIKGKYKVFVYTAHRNEDGDLDGSDEDAIVIRNVNIESDGQIVDLGRINTEKL